MGEEQTRRFADAGTKENQVDPKIIDKILYNFRTWQRLVALTEPVASTSVIRLPVATSSGPSIPERVAMRRAAVTEVLVAVELALKSMPPELRQIARLKYDHQMSYREIARVLTKRARRRVGADQKTTRVSISTVHEKVDAIRNICAQHLRSISGEFWAQIRTLELDGTEQRG